MPDKLTDNEIEKAVKAYEEKILANGIKSLEPFEVRDIIQKQQEELQSLQAENERLKVNNLTLEKCCENCIYEEKALQAQPCCECFSFRNFTPKDFLKLIKAEAYKEFADKLKPEFKNLISCNEGFVYHIIDNLLKELVGEENG